ncbi:MAG: hypothetical protein H6695_01445 [Deferribacteres bacterium]|nr:hypothetical protein [candidate division KSB1 bacterium]MCB9508812.1 hypothetical protein [Deferribacteres bacterium]
MKKQNPAVPRALLLIIIGLMNTVFIRPEDVGSWKNDVGIGLLILAAIQIVYLFVALRKRRKVES